VCWHFCTAARDVQSPVSHCKALKHFLLQLSFDQSSISKGKVALVLKHCTMEVQIHVILTSALVGGEGSDSRPGSFTPRRRVSSRNWIGRYCFSYGSNNGKTSWLGFEPMHVTAEVTIFPRPSLHEELGFFSLRGYNLRWRPQVLSSPIYSMTCRLRETGRNRQMDGRTCAHTHTHIYIYIYG
jgi:hypothetical protein